MKKLCAIFSLCALLFMGCAQQVPVQQGDAQQSTAGITIMTQEPMADGTEEVSPESEGKKANLVAKEVAYYQSNDKVKGYLVMPAGAENLPAVILIHEWWGLNDNMKDMATQFATRGYVALAVDLYDGQIAADPTEAQKLAGMVRENVGGASKNLQAAVDYLKALPEVNKARLASVGWCFGGGWSYQMAKNDMGVKATVMYYGQFNEHDDLSHMKSTIIGHFGENDTGIKVDTVKEFQATLKTLNGDHEVYIYANAGHGFANPDNPNYNREAADTAWQRTMEFLRKYL